eukprot:CAMPEP_0184691608 /NCGR_PEP_ID=MMETSP0313-20130426/407_1 /TAXON_ID=2792 /ORGANISM="Porphyridium aerugineum, Strain SAG 1380-2" /LENGTH=296 /DNA_ID=CAMNT_0027149353 /DNA_START=86 /DNA_END=976 /DNA_ORIENTATION=+
MDKTAAERNLESPPAEVISSVREVKQSRGSALGLPDSQQLVTDVVAAVTASFCLAPFVTTVDKAIISNASGRQPMGECVKSTIASIVKSPLQFLRRPEFLWIWAVYGMTYITSNITETTCMNRNIDPMWPKFIAVSCANISWSVAKDRAFTRMFGTKVPSSLPLISYLMFTSRDLMTVFSSFSLPAKIAPYLTMFDHDSSKLAAAQLVLPVGVQAFSTPLHLMGLNFYNQPQLDIKSRAQVVLKQYPKTLLMRASRIFPAFGIGGVGNRAIRKKLGDYLENRNDDRMGLQMLVPEK